MTDRCHAEDRNDEDGPHKCDRRYGHAGDHNCQCAYAWPQRCPCLYRTRSFDPQSDPEGGDCRDCPHPLDWHGPSGCLA